MRCLFIVALLCVFGVFVVSGQSRAETPQEEISRLEEAAAQGDAAAQTSLGYMYEQGQGVPRYLLKMAAQGNEAAQNHIGLMYYLGLGAPQDYAKAREWFVQAAAKGYAEAQHNLGLMYGKGLGVPQDYARAYMWANLAAAEGWPAAVEARTALTDTLSPSQIEEGQRLTREWLAENPGK